MLPETAENLLDVFFMVRFVFREDQQVVQIDNDIDTYQVLEDVIHHMLERSRSVSQAEGHHGRFEVSFPGPERGLPLVALLDPDVVVAPPEVQGGEYPGLLESVHQLHREGERVPVLYRDLVEFPVVHDHPERTVLFLYEEDRRGSRRFRGPDVTLPEVVFHELGECVALGRGQGIDLTISRSLPRLQVDGMVVGLPARQPLRLHL